MSEEVRRFYALWDEAHPSYWATVRGEVVLASDHDRVVAALKADVAMWKAEYCTEHARVERLTGDLLALRFAEQFKEGE